MALVFPSRLLFLFSLCWSHSLQSSRNEELTPEELRLIFGSWKPNEYSLFRPQIHSPKRSIRGRRDAPPDSIFSFKALGRDFRFRLEPVEDLISPHFALLRRSNATSQFLTGEMPRCAFQGRDDNDQLRVIALIMCGNLRGVVTSPDEELVIEPLPETLRSHHRFQKRWKRRRRRNAVVIGEHIIYRVNQKADCSFLDGSGNPSLDQLRRGYLFSRRPPSTDNHFTPERGKEAAFFSDSSSIQETNENFSGDIFYIETAVFVDQDLLKHMQTNFPSNTEEEVARVVLAMVNAVQLLYNDPSLGHRIKYVLKRLELLYQDPRGLLRPHDIDEFLTKFCSWQHLENPQSDSDALHWDHALILTGLDLYTVTEEGAINSQVVGLAPVAGMCTRTSSCTVNEGRHFESVYVVAHEIGHNLGMRHDGLQSGNNCDPSGFLMSPTLGSGKVTWSHCSKRYLNKFLQNSQSKCLRDRPRLPASELDHEGQLLPGQRFSADQQCVLKYGVGSRSSDSQVDHDICRDLHCIRDHFTWTSHPALEGTECGHNKRCQRGYCVNSPLHGALEATEKSTLFLPFSSSLTTVAPFFPSSGVGGEWGEWSECQSSCLYGIDGILSSGSSGLSVSQRQCHNCQGEYRYRTCSFVRQCGVRQKKTLQDFADEVCLHHMREDASLSAYSVRLSMTGIRWCHVECLSATGSVVPTRAFFPDGTVCHTEATAFPTYCINGLCTEFRCESNSLYGAGPHICRSSNLPTLPLSPPPPPDIKISFGNSIESDQTSAEVSWAPWAASSDCRFSCISPSRGIQLVSRSCLHPYGCDGLNRNIQLCQPSHGECSIINTPFTFASDICQKYSKTIEQLSGFGMQLSSTLLDPNRACTVACQDSALKYRFYKVNGKDGWFPFGTECSSQNGAYESFCLNGKCLEFGSDGTPLRDKRDFSNEPPSIRSRSLNFVPLVSNIPVLNYLRQGLFHLPRRLKRHVKTTAHRLPGSLEDAFLLALIDEVNVTLASNITGWGGWSDGVDLENPLFYGEIPVSSDSSNVTTAKERLFSPSDNTSRIYRWTPQSLPCSASCGRGKSKEVYHCVDDNDSPTDDALCNHQNRPPDVVNPCVAKTPCSNPSAPSGYPKDSSPFARWLLDLVDHVRTRVD